MDNFGNILVTGATGLLGSHLLVRLAADGRRSNVDGFKVYGLRRSGSNMEGVRQVFSYYGDGWEELYDSIEWRFGDVLDSESLEKALEGIDLVYHCAAIVSFDPSERERIINANIQGTRNLVTALLDDRQKTVIPANAGTQWHTTERKLVHISSTSALGDSPGNDPSFLVNEETPRDPERRHSGYSVSKFESEKIVWEAIDQGLDAMIVNPGIILGPGFWDKGSSKLFSTINKGLKFYTSGGTGYVDVRDVVEVVVKMRHSTISILQSPIKTRYCLVGANAYFKDFFFMVADELGVKRPYILAGKFLSGLAWRVGTLKARLSGSYPLITRETAESANRISFYSGEKVEKALNFKFRSFEDTVKWCCEHLT